MNDGYIKFSSVTTAQRAQRLLHGMGIEARVVKNPGYEKGESCSYAVLTPENKDYIIGLLRKNGIRTGSRGEA